MLITGNLTKDPYPLKKRTGELFGCKLTVAKRQRKQDREKPTVFCTARIINDHFAEAACGKLRKGNSVVIEPFDIEMDEWTGRDGQKQQEMVFVAWDVFVPVWDRESPQEAAEPQQRRAAPSRQQATTDNAPPPFDDDDDTDADNIPF